MIGCLRYLLHTRPDLAYSVGMASRFMEKPTVMHLQAVKQIMRYLKGTVDMGLVYTQAGGEEVLVGYTDSDLSGDLVGRRSTGGMAFYLNGNLITWCSQKQKTVALSSCESEFMAATAATMQAIWLRNLLSEVTSTKTKVVALFVDNNYAIALMKNPIFHGRSKHIDTRYHFIKECIERGQIERREREFKSQWWRSSDRAHARRVFCSYLFCVCLPMRRQLFISGLCLVNAAGISSLC